ncbi:MAG: SDR family oxidoreductase [Deltaproteobacteria bacterium]|nr:SDR family oxidoreductase [Deltaproteobacteria bacterium]
MSYALITGASRGIGKEFALQLAREKKPLILVARSEADLNLLASEIKSKFQIPIEIVPADLSQTGAAKKLYEACISKNLKVDLLINNAGVGYAGDFEKQSFSDLQNLMQINMMSLSEMTYLFGIEMIKNGGGKIIQVASVAGFQPIPYFGLYAATKSFVLHLSEALNEEWKKKNVHVLTLCPGPTKTHFFDAAKMRKKNRDHYESVESVVGNALKALDKRKMIVVSGWFNKVRATGYRFFPRTWVVRVAGMVLKGNDKSL